MVIMKFYSKINFNNVISKLNTYMIFFVDLKFKALKKN